MTFFDIRRRMLEAAAGLHVTEVSTATHTAADLSALTWEELSAYSKAISKDTRHAYSNAIRSVTFSDGMTLGVGDFLNVTIFDVSYRVDIVGFHHDVVTDATVYGGIYAGITWLMHNCYATGYAMNGSDTNSTGWTSCGERSALKHWTSSALSSDLSSVIVSVNKYTSAGNNSSVINTTSDHLFLLSAIEIFGSTSVAYSGEGTQYAYYAAGNSKVKYKPGSGSSAMWWERSPAAGYTTAFCAVYASGVSSLGGASHTYAIAFAFCT